MTLVLNIYGETKRFPTEERFGLSQQMRRAAVSIPSNIAEGAARKSPNELKQFLFIALGSLSELETQVLVSSKLGFLGDHFENLQNELDQIRKMLQGIINNIS